MLLPTLQLHKKPHKPPQICTFTPLSTTGVLPPRNPRIMDAGIAPWESSQAAPKLDLGTPYPLNYSPGSSSCNLLKVCTAGLTLMDGDSLDLLCLEVRKRKFQVGMVLRAATGSCLAIPGQRNCRSQQHPRQLQSTEGSLEDWEILIHEQKRILKHL